MHRHGFLRVTAASPPVQVADPKANVDGMLRVVEAHPDSDVIVFPELSITGYTCGDLFMQQTLLRAAEEQTVRLASKVKNHSALIVVGLPVQVRNGLYNCAAVIVNGAVNRLVAKTFIPTYDEYYERRWFRSPLSDPIPDDEQDHHRFNPNGPCRLGLGNSYQVRWYRPAPQARAAIEICEDLWAPSPPSSAHALRGANLILNPSASTEQVGKSGYRRDLIRQQSARCVAAYVYAGAGPQESTTDVVFSGTCMIAENGHILAETNALQDAPHYAEGVSCTADIDIEALQHRRRAMSTFKPGASAQGEPSPESTMIFARDPLDDEDDEVAQTTISGAEAVTDTLLRSVPAHPFVPSDTAELHSRCQEIFAIQTHALAKRLSSLGADWTANIGISGGLDSTLALLVAVRTCDLLGVERSRVRGLTMPGFGTTQGTRDNATALMNQLGVSAETIDIRPLCLEAFQELSHKPFGLDISGMSLTDFQAAIKKLPAAQLADLTFENVQARVRTFLLMSRGFVIGTGDMSEAALGWSTYNADHMSMYNPNCSVPKTLVKFLVRYVAEHQFEGPARQTLLNICETPISPELLPAGSDGEIVQSTEKTLGPYELHDFFLYHVVRHGAAPQKVLFLASHAKFDGEYSASEIKATLKTFYTRFFAQQYKRSCVPDGPKVGTVALSPRGDWRMPSDANVTAWLNELDEIS
ncbi:NAD(+) synthase [Stratiformator vulcanicus]|uniref:Glutamine-dependent NAD(+) synthetase n=1 Tax=Stratiformator vulcanicus TaxID=2527980 RepID=A0A517R7C8_9PLAN|nr:NAD(+) synthase [Stratiformator vulcanicus]QDT39797.1 Glutamine-dependent NAD(+) synthetase [Stratiformator vulcanicus]